MPGDLPYGQAFLLNLILEHPEETEQVNKHCCAEKNDFGCLERIVKDLHTDIHACNTAMKEINRKSRKSKDDTNIIKKLLCCKVLWAILEVLHAMLNNIETC